MLFILAVVALVALYLYTTRRHDYWAKRNVKHRTPIPLFGNHFLTVSGQKSIIQVATELYNQYPGEKIVGYYRASTPELIVRDLDIARHILTLDFACFYPRGLGRGHEKEPLHAHLFFADGDIWKLLRQRLTPVFTTAKLRGMFPLILNCANKLDAVGQDIVAKGGDCDVRELMARFTTEFIGACGFGIEMDSINNENSLFRALGKKMFTPTLKTISSIAMWELFPMIRSIVPQITKELEEDMTVIVKNICEQRNFKPSGRNDFIDLLLELQDKGIIQGDSVEKRNADGTPQQVELEMTFKIMVAQVFVFFAAGFETSSSATSYTLLKLAYHPDVQREIQQEIDTVLAKYNNELCYDSISEMTLLSCAFKESMRLFPSLGNLHRVCTARYTVPGTDVTIDPGVKVIIPIQAIQTDEQYYEDPLEFRPSRFKTEDGKKNQYTYLPFGIGPRACIGARLGEMQSLAGLAGVLRRFSVSPSAATRREPAVNPASNVVQGVLGGIPLKLELRK